MRGYIFQGLKKEVAFQISAITKHQYYYQNKRTNQGRSPSTTTFYTDKYGQKFEVSNDVIIEEIKQAHQDLDTDYGHRKMETRLQLMGYDINHKKVYRLMKGAQLLKEQHQKPSKTRVKYRKVFPSQPFEVLEMDIKFVWVEEYKMHSYVLTTIDTFTRLVLHWTVAYSIKKEDVKRAWEHIIINHLQPNNCLEKGIHIEVRNDNDSRFSAKMIQNFFKDNYLNQVFTHPYTPQENGHIESFHAILAKKLRPFHFWTIDELEGVLTIFYEKYNNERLHSSVCNLPPNIFLECWNKGLIEQKRDEIKRKITFKLKIPYQQISGNTSLKCSSLQNLEIPPFFVGELNFSEIEMTRPETFLQTSV
ncbi:transposase InsO family protein [Flavobacterium sp. CG_23.5]|uniref:DDE-type integrase/transposase/recombinase n=1 Tax=Flavobacterium sp. CG_23.5 TaxID=2760708 RepID=UPI0018CA7F73|nr:DDE-type integrase/transposase/recombinase [Flavobacterium sp. CG_23.5]MBP2282027.1 transposase InsO family protein [Flavobacterium sp. CG_23.5]MBP2284143.1 transposase InsO family protein [Flavobacterium sp. CG_23.5]MBP2284168.1 transposase InsO family protein [Flavobacterium sp. CG_23.5]MBP2284199.1 transposase InsO family protein [Flavobacterium sp. CG_23.5]MBP2284488.1 transposase InsO family protein [Flavobacterium sp. CG_23.5]